MVQEEAEKEICLEKILRCTVQLKWGNNIIRQRQTMSSKLAAKSSYWESTV